ncbi:hypothetical protein OAV88_01020 [bacterium]|nr:hypothetical protein [bacterium]
MKIIKASLDRRNRRVDSMGVWVCYESECLIEILDFSSGSDSLSLSLSLYFVYI